MTVSAYSILTAPRSDTLAGLVQAAVVLGQQPVGSPFIDPNGLVAQAMITGNPGVDANQTLLGVAAGTKAVLSTLSVVETGDDVEHLTRLALTALNIGNSADNASLALGELLYTFPAGDILIRSAALNLVVSLADAIQTDTPELGLGTVEAAGANATLGAAGATTENIFEGTAIGAVDGVSRLAAGKFPTGGIPLFIKAADVHTVFLNIADAWANLTGASALTATGRVTLDWLRLTES